MTNPYHPQTPSPSGAAGPQDVSSQWAPGQQPAAPQGHQPGGTWRPATAQTEPSAKKPHRGALVAATVGLLIAVFAAGFGGVLVGSRLNESPMASQSTTTAAPPTPTGAEVKAATVDLCTRFAAASRAMPVPQNTGFDVIPTVNYISDALRDNTIADPSIRDAVSKSLKFFRDQVSYLMRADGARGGIQPAIDWSAEDANRSDQRAWDLCRAYGE